MSNKNILTFFALAFFLLLSFSSQAQENKKLQAVKNRTFLACGLDPITGTKTAALKIPGVYKGKFFYEEEKAPIQEEHSWLLYLEDGKGNKMEGAEIHVDGINYDAGRGFAKPPMVKEYLGNGHYLVEGIKFSVEGTWTMRFQVIYDGIADVLSFDIEV
ncbi:MAG: hypothetical protein AAF696_11395 [Bacteroidota bacterium]